MIHPNALDSRQGWGIDIQSWWLWASEIVVHFKGEFSFAFGWETHFLFKFISQNKKGAVIFVWNLRLTSCFKNENAHIFWVIASAVLRVHFYHFGTHLGWRALSTPCPTEGQSFPTGPRACHWGWQSSTHLLLPGDQGPGHIWNVISDWTPNPSHPQMADCLELGKEQNIG